MRDNLLLRWKPHLLGLALMWSLYSCGQNSNPEQIRVAVASNFNPTMLALIEAFERSGGGPVGLVSGSTGKHFAQINHGAPFDLFFAADVQRPLQLEELGRVEAGSRSTYAIGSLVLWSPTASNSNAGTLLGPDHAPNFGPPSNPDQAPDSNHAPSAAEILRKSDFRYLAIANPKLAPYGRAAVEVLQSLELEAQVQGRLVYGENVQQAYHFVQSGNAAFGLISRSQIPSSELAPQGQFWPIPSDLYRPIEQQVALLSAHPQAIKFLAFVLSEPGRAIIRDHGYSTP
jgi:molybdate transport system substrate-binding protein